MLAPLVLAALASCPDWCAASAEIERVREHLLGAERLMDARDLSALTPAQRTARAEARERLRAYRHAGRFPHNHDFVDHRVPYFIDAHGTRCAMAHLIEASGGAGYVQAVARTSNHATVRELAGDRELTAWLQANGLTVEEAARIQPNYGATCSQPSACICGGDYRPYVTTGVVVDRVADASFATVRSSMGERAASFAVGSTLAWNEVDAEGRFLLGFLSGGASEYAEVFLRVSEDGEVSCGALSVPVDVAVSAMSSGRCEQHLVDRDEDWKTDCSGCSAVGGSSSGWFIAVLGVSWMVRRRRTSRRPRSS